MKIFYYQRIFINLVLRTENFFQSEVRIHYLLFHHCFLCYKSTKFLKRRKTMKTKVQVLLVPTIECVDVHIHSCCLRHVGITTFPLQQFFSFKKL